ncbi:type IV pilus modification protein PilV [Granulosicoccus sp.]|nr:type IV pilus modification protein PilV [Granulosicoccus sp.]MDB4222256.1 type IV pilus modification protein PilV [Granulosicoccus sp.]
MVNLLKNKSLNFTGFRKFESGVGLIEILIAVVIMSLGFLAAARMQVEGMRFSQSAYYQSQAHFLANDMIDRMRSNIPGVLTDEYSNEETSSSAARENCTVCTPSEIADLDLFEWSSSLHPLTGAAGFIPALYAPASGRINRIPSDDNPDLQRYEIVMSWTELIQGEDESQTLSIRFDLETRE